MNDFELLAAIENCSDLKQLSLLARDCCRCGLRAGCRGVVFGKGNPDAHLMFIGEGPGAEEDRQGLPFVGAAGQLLDKIILAGGWQLNEVYIANIVKCRPPGNRTPAPQEADACKPWLEKQIALIKPKIIVLLGSVAIQNIIDRGARITRDRGRWYEKNGIRIMPTFHPAALLRDPAKKRPVWEDIKKVRALYDSLIK
ncbi:phage SPO1 DNA polymerase-related protein [Thermincola ferriacetica]|uniref:Type-4 uracil-DNA glycosylase n=1 Tax=Thermincola ferriacetica TaxID=281456 RepID=A0A0L6VYP8_9FIRM|nr:uracil-DNA glycosylase [Thermincola ferriacetica]KNZ68432.1 phage SPO1 DNA polymerase-related protein [Thermincola ferriacetica]